MDVENLVGGEFLEAELYELLLFDIEVDMTRYEGKFLHLYFESLGHQRIKVTEVVFFNDRRELRRAERKAISW